MKKILGRGAFIALLLAMLVFIAPDFSLSPANAQDVAAKTVSKKIATPAKFYGRLMKIVDTNTGIITGPFDIIVGTTDKAAAGIKYSNVPYFVLLDGAAVFPNGDRGKKGRDILVFTSNFTVRTK